MTRMVICQAQSLEALEVDVNAEIERLEADGFGVKCVFELAPPPAHAIAIVYGKGPTTTQRWSGAHG